MAVETTDKKNHWEGIPCSKESLEEYEAVWKEMEECIAYCNKHLDKKKKK